MSSAGSGALVDEPMNAPALRVLEAAGYSADGFRARALTPAVVAESDLVLTATRQHRGKVVRLHPRALRYTFALMDFADLVSDLPREGLRCRRPRRPHPQPAQGCRRAPGDATAAARGGGQRG